MSRLAAVRWKRPAVKRNVALSDLGSSGRKPAMNHCSRSKCFGATADGICSFLTLPSTLQEIEMRPPVDIIAKIITLAIGGAGVHGDSGSVGGAANHIECA